MAQYRDLELLELRGAKTESHERHHTPEHHVQERPPHQLLPSSIEPATLRARSTPKRRPPTHDQVLAPHRRKSELSPSPSVVAASTSNREDHEDDYEHPQQRTYGEASHQRQDDENDEQHDDEVHADEPTPESRHGHPRRLLRKQPGNP